MRIVDRSVVFTPNFLLLKENEAGPIKFCLGRPIDLDRETLKHS